MRLKNSKVFLNTKSKGREGEDIAAHYLQKKGYRILERNYKTKFAEADIITQYQDKLVFVEVKYRSSLKFGHPFEAVNPRKLHKLKLLAQHYVRTCAPDLKPCIEVVSVWQENGELKLKHIQGIIF